MNNLTITHIPRYAGIALATSSVSDCSRYFSVTQARHYSVRALFVSAVSSFMVGCMGDESPLPTESSTATYTVCLPNCSWGGRFLQSISGVSHDAFKSGYSAQKSLSSTYQIFFTWLYRVCSPCGASGGLMNPHPLHAMRSSLDDALSDADGLSADIHAIHELGLLLSENRDCSPAHVAHLLGTMTASARNHLESLKELNNHIALLCYQQQGQQGGQE